jgi:pimeloyl-ACP methyl ester carboxylesterase
LGSKTIVAGGVRTRYAEAGGDGPPIVLCHGAGPGASGEAGFSRVMPFLGGAFHVYAPDSVGGFGATDPQAPTPNGLLDRVTHLETFIETLGLENVTVGGNSQGAWVAAAYALRHPERVRKMLLIGSNTIANAMGISTPEGEGTRAIAEYDGTPAAMRRFMCAVLYNKELVTDELVALRLSAANAPGMAEARKRFAAGTKAFRADPVLGREFDMRESLPKLGVPALFLWGAEDDYAPVTVAKALEAMLPKIPFVFVPQAAHQAQTDQPEFVAGQMIQFMRK